MATPRELLAEARARVREVTPEQAADLIESGANLLDVREGEEVGQGLIPGAVDDEGLILGRHPSFDLELEVASGHVNRAGYESLADLLAFADVEQVRSGIDQVGRLLRGDFADASPRFSQQFPRRSHARS